MAEGNGILSAIELFDLGFLSIPVKNVKNEMRVVTGHRAKELTHPFFLLDEFRDFYKQEPDAWAAVCGYKGLQGYLVYIDAEESKIADAARKKIVARFGKEYREEFGSKGAHFPIIVTDAPVEKRTEFFKGDTTSDNLVMEVLTDWLCILPGSKHRKTGGEYTLTHAGTIPKMKKEELSELLAEVERENKLTHRQKKSDAPVNVDEELAEIKIRYTFFELGLKPGLQSCPLPGHKHNDASPSLSVSQDGRVANCFSVHGGMDVFKYIELRDNCNFPTAKQKLKSLIFPTSPPSKTTKDSANTTVSHKLAQSAQDTQQWKCAPLFLDDILLDDSAEDAIHADSADNAPLKGVALSSLAHLLFGSENQEIQWLLPNILPIQSITMLAAKRASLKTFIALYFGLSAATGMPNVLGVPQPVKVLYVDYENGEFELRRRLRGVLATMTEEQKKLARTNFITTITPPIKLDDGKTPLLIRAIKASGAKVVFIDTMRRLSNGEENASETSNDTLDGLQRAVRETGCSFVLLHHLRKGNAQKNVEIDEMDEIRGSSDITASCSVIFSLKRQGTSDKFILKQLKNRYGAERKPIQLHIEGQAPEPVSIVSDGEIEDAAISDNMLVNEIWNWLVSCRKFVFSTSDINKQFIGAPPYRYSKRSVSDAISILHANGKILREKKGQYSMVLPKKQKDLIEGSEKLFENGLAEVIV